ncbi:TetR/AcrR family transcriptional regulator [Paenibacillus sp. BSR1-1]|uniref:TetR/AcrR family transcriptional regulator n=1 Tax=Paenibacillus sp. BSR1-1 TaxID=3020845 RepID=UPI0025AF5411|nr:TetR/AcrR family transcriptional regulator [Paenibacillus sp. BSR1-1]MDN3015313.1 TetR/AcrR family transcriptional regulator [Paenibacillus sp. BSR1-1]
MPPVVSDKYKQEKKAAILKSAFECFAEKGFQVATIDDIVAHSKISKGAIYNYFNSKDDIYIELMNQHTNENITSLKRELEKLADTREKLDYFFHLYSHLDQHPQFSNSTRVHIEFWLYSTRKNELRDIMLARYELYKNLFKRILVEGIEKGEISTHVNPDELSFIFWGVIDGISLHFAMLLDQYPYQKVYKEIQELIYTKLGFN